MCYRRFFQGKLLGLQRKKNTFTQGLPNPLSPLV
jgi:hypothetical protein